MMGGAPACPYEAARRSKFGRKRMKLETVTRGLTLPLQMAPALLIDVFSLLLTLATKASFLGIPLAILLVTGLVNYAHTTLDLIADGIAEPPVLSIEMMNPVGSSRTVMLLFNVGIAFFLSGAASWWWGPAPAAAVAILCLALLPAMVAVHAVSGNAAEAMNPAVCLRLVRRLGNDYLIVLGCVILLAVAGWTVFASGLGLPLVIRIAAALYLWLALFALVGNVLSGRRDDVGVDYVVEPETHELDSQPATERSRDQQVDRIYASWRG